MASGRKMKLSTKIIFLGCAVALLMAAINAYTVPFLAQRIDAEKRLKTKHLVDSAASMIIHFATLAQNGKVKAEEAKAMAVAAVKDLRYGDNDYFWLNDYHPRMIMHPTNPVLDGKDLTDNKDPDGKQIFVEMVKIARSEGAGFVDYQWPKPGSTKPVPKISYVKNIPQWSWVVGSGIYVDDVARDVNRIITLIVTIVLVILILAILASWFFARALTKPLVRVATTLSQGSSEIDLASKQVSDSSQSLAEGSSEQAASLEETSSSLEELSSLTKATAENSETADQVMLKTRDTISKAGEEMNEIAQSMSKIAESGEEIGKIVKSIDEISFQTNLLALNAAVEAARAGDAGAGFAVVADEVRSLAMRAAEAAKSTQDLVEDTVRRIGQGSDIVERTKSGFAELIASSKEAADLVTQIAKASNEQAQGISQINQAVAQVDQVVQSNAATAEESASASEELSSQAAVINQVVATLMGLIGVRAESVSSGPAERPAIRRIAAAPKAKMVASDIDDLDEF